MVRRGQCLCIHVAISFLDTMLHRISVGSVAFPCMQISVASSVQEWYEAA
jgi:hypothetical protein